MFRKLVQQQSSGKRHYYWLNKSKSSLINKQEPDGNTQLHLAARDGNLEMVKLLLDVGADKRIRNVDGQRPVDLAVNYPDVVVLLGSHRVWMEKKADADCEGLSLKAFLSSMEEIASNHKSIALNAQDQDGNTPLHLAAFIGEVEAVKMLVEAGANVNVCNNDGKTPLDIVLI